MPMPATLRHSSQNPVNGGVGSKCDVTALFPHNKTWRRAANHNAYFYNSQPIGILLPPVRPTIVRITIGVTTTGAGLQYLLPQLVHLRSYVNQRKLTAVPCDFGQEKDNHCRILKPRIGKGGV